MRKLQAHDIFAFGRVVKEIGLKEELKSICMNSNNIQDVYESGFELLFTLFEKATTDKAENELLKFFADIFEEEVDSVKTSDPVEFLDKLMEVAEPKKWRDFFTRAASLIR